VSSDSKVWIKENLINLGIKTLPEDWKFVAWIDADITFLNQNWVDETKEKLQSSDIVQLWQMQSIWGQRGKFLKLTRVLPTCIKRVKRLGHQMTSTDFGTPGLHGRVPERRTEPWMDLSIGQSWVRPTDTWPCHLLG
jgi:hypothetical protein